MLMHVRTRTARQAGSLEGSPHAAGDAKTVTPAAIAAIAAAVASDDVINPMT